MPYDMAYMAKAHMANRATARRKRKLGGVAILKLYVPEDQRRIVALFKTLCAARGTSVSAALLAHMERDVAGVDFGGLAEKADK